MMKYLHIFIENKNIVTLLSFFKLLIGKNPKMSIQFLIVKQREK